MGQSVAINYSKIANATSAEADFLGPEQLSLDYYTTLLHYTLHNIKCQSVKRCWVGICSIQKVMQTLRALWHPKAADKPTASYSENNRKCRNAKKYIPFSKTMQ
jgi:hypothetical protein